LPGDIDVVDSLEIAIHPLVCVEKLKADR